MTQCSGSFDCLASLSFVLYDLPCPQPLCFASTLEYAVVPLLLLSLLQFNFCARVHLVLVFSICQQLGSVVPLSPSFSFCAKIDLTLVFSICQQFGSVVPLAPSFSFCAIIDLTLVFSICQQFGSVVPLTLFSLICVKLEYLNTLVG